MLLTFAIRFFTMPALAARPTSIASVNYNADDTCFTRLIFNKGAQLEKSPVAHEPTHFSVQAGSFSNTFQVFQRKCLLRCSGVFNEFFRDAMILVSNESLLALRRFLQTTFRRLSAALLQAPSVFAQLFPKSFDFLARIRLAFAGGGYLYNAKICYTKGMRGTDYKHLKHAGIYLLRNNVTNKIYVGQATNIYRRIYDHMRPKNSSRISKLYRSAAKYGWDAFTCELLEKVDALEMLNERETFWIQHFQSHKKTVGYNICEFGGVTLGRRHSDETRQKMSDNRPSYSGESNPFFGKKHSEESKAKVGAANAKWERTEEYKAKLKAAKSPKSGWQTKKVQQINPETGDVIKVWGNRFEAANAVQIHHSNIARVCRHPTHKAKGYWWRYVE